MDDLFSVWLVTQENDEEYLSKMVKDLAHEYQSPTFTPHLTLLGGINSNFEDLKDAIDKTFDTIKPFKIKKTRLNQSELFFKTVFIEFELDENLQNVFTTLSDNTDKGSIEEFKPHISLMYKTMREEEKLKVIEKLSVKDEFLIDSVYIQAPKQGDHDFLNVEGWRIFYKKKLRELTNEAGNN